MKPQCSCLAMFGAPRMYGGPWLVGNGWRAEDVARLMRLLARPLLMAIVTVAVIVGLLLGGRALAPFVVGGVGGPGQMTSMSAERADAERNLQAETDRLLASFETTEPLSTNGELP